MSLGKSPSGGGGNTTTVTNVSQPPPAVEAAYTNLTNRADTVSQQPLTQYSGPYVQGFNPQQNQAFGTIQNLQGAYAPYLNSAANSFSGSTQPLWQSLSSYDTSGVPQAGYGALTAGQNYAASAAQPIDVNPYTGFATSAAAGLGATEPQYANIATTAAGGIDPSQYQNFTSAAAAGLGAAAPQYANLVTNAAQNVNTAPYQNFATGAAAGLGAATPQYANMVANAAQNINTAPYQDLATQPLTTQGYGSLGEYLSPYTSNVTSALQNLFNQQNATQLSQVRGNAAAQGALGGDREAVAEALTAQQQQTAEAPVLAQTLQQGFQQAQGELNAQQQLQLQQGVSQGQLGLGAGQLGVQGAQAAGGLGATAGQLVNQAAATQVQAGLGAGQLGVQGAQTAGGLGATAGQLINQAAATQGQLGLGAGQLGVQAGTAQGQLGLGAGQLLNQVGQTQVQAGLGAAGATTQALGTQGQLALGAGQLTGQMGQAELGQYNQQQQTQLAAEQANAWLGQGAGYGMANLGSQAQALGLAGAAAEGQAGAVQQALAQQQLNIPIEQFQQQQAYPYQQLNFLAPIVEGTGSLSGGTGSTTSPGPSLISQVAGLGLTGLGTYGLLNQTGAFGSNGYLTGAGGLFGGASALTPAAAGLASGFGDAFGAGSIDLGTLALGALAARGGRIKRDGGGPVPIQPDAGLGMPQIPSIGLGYMQPASAVHGSGPPKGPAPSTQSSGFDPSTILKDLNAAESMVKLSGLGSPVGEASGGSISPPGLTRGFHPHVGLPHLGYAPHLGASGIGLHAPALQHLQGGGEIMPLEAATPLSGTSPNVQGMYQQFTQLPEEKLRELALRVPPTTPQGKLIQRAIQAKVMSPAPLSAPPTIGADQGVGLAAGGRIHRQGGGPLGGAANAPQFQLPLGLYSPSLVHASNPISSPAPRVSLPTQAPQAQNPLAGVSAPQTSLPTQAPQARNALAGLTNPQSFLPTSAPQPANAWPTPYQYNPGQSPVSGLASPSRPTSNQALAAPTLDPNIFTSYGAFGQAGPQNFSYYGVGIPNADIRQFSLPQLSRGGRPHRQDGGGLGDPGNDITDGELARLRSLWGSASDFGAAKEVQAQPAAPRPTMASGLAQPSVEREDLPTHPPSISVPLGEGLGAPPPQERAPATEPTSGAEPQGGVAGHNLQNNNPGNIKAPGGGWQSFSSPQAGIDAIGNWLTRAQDVHGLTTVRQLIDDPRHGYAPLADPGNWMSDPNTGQRIPKPLVRDAAARLGVDPDAPVDMSNPEMRTKMVDAIMMQEQGKPSSAYLAGGPSGRRAPGTTGYMVPADQSGDQVIGRQPYMRDLGPVPTQHADYAPPPHERSATTNMLSSPWMIPLTVGAGMLASRSPYFTQALGEGVIGGVKEAGQQADRESRQDLADTKAWYQGQLAQVRNDSVQAKAQSLWEMANHHNLQDKQAAENAAEKADYQSRMAGAAEQNARTRAILSTVTGDKPLSWYVPGTDQAGTTKWDPDPTKSYIMPPGAVVGKPPSATLTGQMGVMNKLMQPGPNGEPPAADSPERALAIMKDPGNAQHQKAVSQQAEFMTAEQRKEFDAHNTDPNQQFNVRAKLEQNRKIVEESLKAKIEAPAPQAAPAQQPTSPATPAATPAQLPEIIQNGWRYRLENGQYTPIGPAQ